MSALVSSAKPFLRLRTSVITGTPDDQPPKIGPIIATIFFAPVYPKNTFRARDRVRPRS